MTSIFEKERVGCKLTFGDLRVKKAKVADNNRLKRKLDQLAVADPDYWSFRGNAKRDHGHGLMQYPAMMVPQMVRALMEAANEVEGVQKAGDPFVGSGTVLTEASLRGWDFVGRDINPLAILLCKVKAGPIFPEAWAERSDELLRTVRLDGRESIDVQFNGIDKWFSRETQRSLSRIRRAIVGERGQAARRFWWVALAETVRHCSNSRTSTFKLHTRSASELRDRQVDVQGIFEKTLRRNLLKLDSLARTLRERSHLDHGRYTAKVDLILGDAKQPFAAADVRESCDLVITSPPYGDNASTVPYGQYSYLPLQWIDMDDIDPVANSTYLETTHEIDRRSLGGSKRIDPAVMASLIERSSSLSETVARLADAPRDRTQRVVSFVRDLDRCIPHVLGMLRDGGLMVWVLGNRRVGGTPVPLDAILGELLEERGGTIVADVRRRIPSKRMAVRNSVAETMAMETILVVRKAVTNA